MLYRAGPVSIYVRVRARFGTRVAEWLLALVMALWGVSLLLTNTYDTSPTFGYMRHLIPENVLGWTMVGFGLLGLVGLFINGARQDVTPWIRVARAAVGFMLFTLISFSFTLAGTLGVWVAIYPVFAIFEVANVLRAAHDAGEYRGMA